MGNARWWRQRPVRNALCWISEPPAVHERQDVLDPSIVEQEECCAIGCLGKQAARMGSKWLGRRGQSKLLNITGENSGTW
jgi:hypothetical protein